MVGTITTFEDIETVVERERRGRIAISCLLVKSKQTAMLEEVEWILARDALEMKLEELPTEKIGGCGQETVSRSKVVQKLKGSWENRFTALLIF